MKKTNRYLLVLVLLIVSISEKVRANEQELQNSITIGAVTQSKLNSLDPEKTGYLGCSNFKGTLHQNTVWITPKGTGGSGNYKHTLIWRLGSGYEGYNGFEKQFERTVGDERDFAITIPALRDEIPYVQQSVLLLTKDLETGKTVSTEKMFTVSRLVVLSQSTDSKSTAENCYQRYPAFESMVGVLSNGTTNPSQLTIKQGIQKLWQSNSGSAWGYYISPLSLVSYAGFSLGNLFSFNKNYFSNISKQTTETIEVSSGYQLSPGDYAQIYTQRTRYITHYDATLVDACGNTTTFPGAYKLQWWGFSYHAVPINPFDPQRPNPDNIGVKQMNTCPAALNSDFGGNNAYEFYRTNL